MKSQMIVAIAIVNAFLVAGCASRVEPDPASGDNATESGDRVSTYPPSCSRSVRCARLIHSA